MKTKILMLSMFFSALVCQLTLAQGDRHFSTSAAVRSLTDSGESMLANESDSQTAEVARPVQRPVGRNLRLTSYQHDPIDMGMLAPTVTESYPSSQGYSECCASSCSQGACDSCRVGCGGCASPTTCWLTAETLLFFAGNRRSPPLVMTADDGVNPLDGQVAYGGVLSSDVLPGFRASVGSYLGPCSRIGVGARAYGIYDNTDRYSVGSDDGTTSIDVPFYNPFSVPEPGDDAFVVAGNLPNGNPISVGSLNASESLSMIGAEGSGYVMLSRGPCCRFDLVAGYTYNQLRNAVYQNFSSTNLQTGDGIVDGTQFQFQDRFATDNRFSGAHLGVLSNVVRKRISLSTLAKVSFGDMRSHTRINGSSVVTVPGANPNDPPTVSNGAGFFARSGNIGTYTDQRFAFLPEMGIKMGYCVCRNVQLSVGYTLLVWSAAAMAGDQIDYIVDETGATDRPTRLNNTSPFWMQSIDLGLNFVF